MNGDSGMVKWPYPLEWGKREDLQADILVVGGGIAGCWAAIAAAQRGAKVILLEKGATVSSGAAGSGCDHWESAATNPCSKVSPEELAQAMISEHGGYNNGISHYIECREGFDRLLDMERMGGKIRDSEDNFVGAEFRDPRSKFLFAYDYQNKFTMRVWGTTFKPALYNECRKLGVTIFDRTMVNGLLTEGGKNGNRVIGAVSVNTRTGGILVVRAKATILCISRPTRIWLFSAAFPGLSEFRPPQCNGDGHAMAWRIGVEFTMMEKSVQAEWSGERSYPPYGTGNTHNTWYACSMVDAQGREIPWFDRDGKRLTTVSQRHRPARGQRFFIKGGGESYFPSYEHMGPEIAPVDELLQQGFKLPFFADLSRLSKHERQVIWGMMVGEEGKTKIPILSNYKRKGFDPRKHILQSYGEGWRSGAFLANERQIFGIPGGIFNDWTLSTNLPGLYAAGDQLFASNCHGHAAATGYYAARHASHWTKNMNHAAICESQVKREIENIYRPIESRGNLNWKELNMAIARIMQNYCGDMKSEELLAAGLWHLDDIQNNLVPLLKAENPHELIRSLEVNNILTNAKLVIHSCQARKASAKHLHFKRIDYPDLDPDEWHKFIIIKQENGDLRVTDRDINYYGDFESEYQRHNKESQSYGGNHG